MIKFILGLFIGANVGLAIFALIQAGKEDTNE